MITEIKSVEINENEVILEGINLETIFTSENLYEELEEENVRFVFDRHEHGGSNLKYLWKVCASQMPECCLGEKLLVGCIVSRKFHADRKTVELLWSFFCAGIGPLRGLGCLPSHLVRCGFKTGRCPSAPNGLGVRADLRQLLGMVQKS